MFSAMHPAMQSAPLQRPYDRARSLAAEPGASVRLAVLLAVALVAVLPHAGQAQVLDNTQDAYRTTVSAWLGPISAIARRLFVALAAIEVSVSGIIYAMRRDSLDEVATKFLFKFIVLSFVLMLISSAGFWLKPIVNGLATAGQVGGGGVSAVGPSGIVDIGLRIAWGLIDTTGLPLSLASFETAAYALTSRIIITLSFVAVAVMVILTWVEAYVALAGGVLFLGFGGSRMTAQFAENYLAFLFYIGARLFTLYLLLGIGITIIQTQIASMPPAMTPSQMGELLAMSVIFAAITLRVPTSLASRVAGTGSFGIAAALRAL
jgi:type IV secretion system protein TrbL